MYIQCDGLSEGICYMTFSSTNRCENELQKYVFSLFVLNVILKGLTGQICSFLHGEIVFVDNCVYFGMKLQRTILVNYQKNCANSFQGLKVLKIVKFGHLAFCYLKHVLLFCFIFIRFLVDAINQLSRD